ncbi:MAG TPA: DNA-3-methyladenine glycosylase [Gammaproteobacteria bacterium]|nr:DNA-3-methyladenine glycosylase [Gammaproteobacteria bacterium]
MTVQPAVSRYPLRRLTRRDLPEETVALARWLIGKTLVRAWRRGRLVGRIVETEAYLPGDAACHAFAGPTQRNRALFMAHGHAYVYFIYGNHFMLNVSSEREGIGAGVLLRAIEPLEGIEAMQRRRGVERVRELCNGPGKLAQAFGINMSLYGLDYCAAGPLWFAEAVRPTGRIGTSRRIGITRNARRLLRFYERGNPFVSGPRALKR